MMEVMKIGMMTIRVIVRVLGIFNTFNQCLHGIFEFEKKAEFCSHKNCFPTNKKNMFPQQSLPPYEVLLW